MSTLTLVMRSFVRHGARGGLARVLFALRAWAEHEAAHVPTGEHGDTAFACWPPDCAALDRAYDWLDA